MHMKTTRPGFLFSSLSSSSCAPLTFYAPRSPLPSPSFSCSGWHLSHCVILAAGLFTASCMCERVGIRCRKKASDKVAPFFTDLSSSLFTLFHSLSLLLLSLLSCSSHSTLHTSTFTSSSSSFCLTLAPTSFHSRKLANRFNVCSKKGKIITLDPWVMFCILHIKTTTTKGQED